MWSKGLFPIKQSIGPLVTLEAPHLPGRQTKQVRQGRGAGKRSKAAMKVVHIIESDEEEGGEEGGGGRKRDGGEVAMLKGHVEEGGGAKAGGEEGAVGAGPWNVEGGGGARPQLGLADAGITGASEGRRGHLRGGEEGSGERGESDGLAEGWVGVQEDWTFHRTVSMAVCLCMRGMVVYWCVMDGQIRTCIHVYH